MRILIIIAVLSAIVMVPQVRERITQMAKSASDSVFSDLTRHSVLDQKAREREHLFRHIGTVPQTQRSAFNSGGMHQESAPALSLPAAPDVSEELKNDRWKTTRQITY